MNLRPYQEDVLERAAAASAAARGILIQMHTGLGKTRVAVEACVRHVKLGGTPLFVASRRELLTQASVALEDGGLHPSRDVFVRSIQELSMPGADVPRASLVVLDEARHYVADSWSKLRAALPDAICLGLDATPERGDGRGLDSMFDVIIESISIKDAIAQGYLVAPDVIRPSRALGPGELAQDPVDAYFSHAKGTSAVLFAPSVELAQEYAERIRQRGARAEAVWGDMPERLRDVALHYYEKGIVNVLCNVGLLTEGHDSPRTETVILAGGIGTAGGFLQRVGRALRPYQGKTRALILDLRGVSHTFGEPDDDRSWHLEGKACRRAKDDIEVRFCPVCGSPSETVACDACGYTGELRKRKPRVLGLPMDRFAREHQASDEVAAKALAGLYRFAQSRNYRRGWAEKVFSHKYGRPVTWELKRLAIKMTG